ncbi:unnamed protein product [Taenia asiatica]|uniref:Secreted protein n=1 Tax=Taenia asiatica TaxID=60517 RepID=A0A0R3WGP3_TAEAS|nr:unnamed protein product [Taenia asiatica]
MRAPEGSTVVLLLSIGMPDSLSGMSTSCASATTPLRLQEKLRMMDMAGYRIIPRHREEATRPSPAFTRSLLFARGAGGMVMK